jgi:hypothetical protein
MPVLAHVLQPNRRLCGQQIRKRRESLTIVV